MVLDRSVTFRLPLIRRSPPSLLQHGSYRVSVGAVLWVAGKVGVVLVPGALRQWWVSVVAGKAMVVRVRS